jgi:Fe-S-cluster-containing hydrogenase component 2
MGDKRIIIDSSKCKLSGECMKVCPQKAIILKNGATTIDYDKCDADGMCIPACPEGAITMTESD